MGCGQSKIGIIYPRKNKRKGCNKKSGVDVDGEEEAEEADRRAASPTSDEDEEAKKKAAAARIRQLVSSGPLLAHTEISSSQMDFFKMLDEKIENGADYDSGNEDEKALERSRLAGLMRDWETASCSTSSGSRSLPPTPARKYTASAYPHKQFYQHHQQQQQHHQHHLPPQPPHHPHHPPPVPLSNGDLFIQQQYYQQYQHQQPYQLRGQYYMPPAQPKYPRPAPHFAPRTHQGFQPQAPTATAMLRYSRERGIYTELA